MKKTILDKLKRKFRNKSIQHSEKPNSIKVVHEKVDHDESDSDLDSVVGPILEDSSADEQSDYNDSDSTNDNALENDSENELDNEKIVQSIAKNADAQIEESRQWINTVGKVNMDWYKGSICHSILDYPHIGYDVDGKKVFKPATADQLDDFLSKMEDPDDWKTFYNKYEGIKMKLSSHEVDIINRIQANAIPDASYDPYEPWVEWFSSKVEVMPLSGASDPKRRFVPSKHEARKVMKLVKAIREGRIVLNAPKTIKPRFYDLWNEAGKALSKDHIAAPKMKLPETSESYNPPPEYLMTPEEIQEWQSLDPQDREYNYIPKKHDSLRSVGAYPELISERFNRCLDLYMCPRVIKNKLNIDPESLIPKLPDPQELRPFPTRLAVTYKGHSSKVHSMSVDPSGHWLLSADEASVRLWEVNSGRQLQQWDVECTNLSWNPNGNVFAMCHGNQCSLVVPRMCTNDLVLGPMTSQKVVWEIAKKDGFWIHLTLDGVVSQVVWHKKGDYFATIASNHVLIHQLSKAQSQSPFKKTKGLVQKVQFHPTKPYFFVASQQYVRIYDLMKQELVKKLEPNVKWISSLDVHPRGDNVIVGSYDRLLSWFDLDLSSKPYKCVGGESAIRGVAFSKRYPLFAVGRDDGSVGVWHGMVYSDLSKNPRLVPVKILKSRGAVMGVEFHPTQPWVFSCHSDGMIRCFS